MSKERLALIEDEAGHFIGFPELVVEVLSPGESNIRRDGHCLLSIGHRSVGDHRETKLKLYSVQGVQEYWIVDRWAQRLEVYRRQDGQLS